MRKNLFWLLMVALLVFASLHSGCGGGSSNAPVSEENGTNQNQQQQQQNVPDNPTIPETPTSPDNPATPDNPTTPENPTTPDNPATPDNPESGTISAISLNGTWTGTGSGTGSNSGITAPVNTEVRYIISNVNEASGTADIQIYDRTTNSQYGVNLVRDWRHASQFSMTSSGANSWAFHRIYSDGEDNIVITLNSATSGTLYLTGTMWNEDNPSDRTTYDITCNITKQ